MCSHVRYFELIYIGMGTNRPVVWVRTQNEYKSIELGTNDCVRNNRGYETNEYLLAHVYPRSRQFACFFPELSLTS